ncbi:uncharacterized protein LOC114793418 [Denticeps clupeoides]|uniref:uncharacterized protein LOC114793418 n=1 Tax=Denticeps clupeoides TaxID=299321 RepID=UPI0010A54CC1|nr:uncharacterized protein LOC114793418 [Denticeps clupeoides]
MRRKTAARRHVGCEFEAAGEPEGGEREADAAAPPSPASCHRLQKRRKRGGEETAPGATGSAELRTRGFELDNFITEHGKDTTEILGGLQSQSKAELVAMVLNMHREMDNLREQIRCLVACGRLAQNLESLVERTDSWITNSTRVMSPQIFVTSGVPSQVIAHDVPNGRWSKMLTNHSRACDAHTVHAAVNGGEPQGKSAPVFQDFITAELLDRCNTGTTAQKLTNDLLRGLYERDCLASHSISGIVNNKRGQPKPALPADEVQAILRAVQHFFPGKTDSEIKSYIRQKLQNEAKRLRKKPHPESNSASDGIRTATVNT